MTTTFPWDQFDTITFERGVCIRRRPSGEWVYLNSDNGMSVSVPDRVATVLGVRPILAEGTHADARVSFLLPALKGRLLDIYRDDLDLPTALRFVMGGMLYHCGSLARLYADACAAFADQRGAGPAAGGSPARGREDTVPTKKEKPFYLFETILSTLIIGFEYCRFPIWRRYGTAATAPRNFAAAIEGCDLPPALAERIRSIKASCYLPAKHYRHCIQHNLDAAAASWCQFTRRRPSLWGLTVRLPDNPQEKSSEDFSFDQGFDALTLAWEYVSEFFAMTDLLLGEGRLSSS